MQSSSDIFLGWVRGRRGLRFLRAPVARHEDVDAHRGVHRRATRALRRICGWTLARAHAKSGDAATISGYLGKGDTFDRAMGAFALAYADQTRNDHAALVKAIRSGRIEALQEY